MIKSTNGHRQRREGCRNPIGFRRAALDMECESPRRDLDMAGRTGRGKFGTETECIGDDGHEAGLFRNGDELANPGPKASRVAALDIHDTRTAEPTDKTFPRGKTGYPS